MLLKPQQIRASVDLYRDTGLHIWWPVPTVLDPGSTHLSASGMPPTVSGQQRHLAAREPCTVKFQPKKKFLLCYTLKDTLLYSFCQQKYTCKSNKMNAYANSPTNTILTGLPIQHENCQTATSQLTDIRPISEVQEFLDV